MKGNDMKGQAESLVSLLSARLSVLQEITFLPIDLPEVDPIGYRALIMAKMFLISPGQPLPEELRDWLGKISDESLH